VSNSKYFVYIKQNVKCLFNGFAFHFSGPRHMSAVCLRRRRLFGQGCRKKARKHKRNART